VSVSDKGLSLVESHLEKFGFVPENNLMVSRLRTALAEGNQQKAQMQASIFTSYLNPL
jgi:hypothetical protein